MKQRSLHAVISCGVKPWFDAFVGAQGGSKDGDRIPGMTKKKFSKLELSLLHLQTIAHASDACPNISHIPQKQLNKSLFLNTSHGHINMWIKAIQAVTKLSRDVPSGTALQEIKFWLSLERALEGIEVQLHSNEVTMVMECLRNISQQSMWDDFIKEFTNIARLVMRKGGEKFVPIKVVAAHAKLQEQTRYLCNWRKQHEQQAVMMRPTKGLGSMTKEVGGMDMEEEVKEVYEVVKRIDVLDVSVEIWVAAENTYDEQVKNQINARLHDRLGTARNANEMFRICGTIQECQTQFSDSVKEDIDHLHDKFKPRYWFSEAYHISMCNLPPIAGAIIWVWQIEQQGWELYAEGQKLQSESTAFRKKLDTWPVYNAWLHDINQRNMGWRFEHGCGLEAN
ncbi:dynein heavy chain, N-terminal region 1-domain-containing protein [Suillus subluteus]|nr:dynein heavy chain, N-terminal region 1-domain-containing protein [Suillus subluteus]